MVMAIANPSLWGNPIPSWRILPDFDPSMTYDPRKS
jgi:hypothetical protein